MPSLLQDRKCEIQENLTKIEEKIKNACVRVNRNPKEIKIIAVSKFFPTSDIKIANNLGLNNFGENRVQELLKKFNEIGTEVNWHQIGHLQINKVKYVLDKVKLIHSVCSIKLIEEIEKCAKKIGKVSEILLQVNISKEEFKFGILIEDIDIFLEKISNCKNIKVKGLMTMAPFSENPKDVRYVFTNLHALFDNIAKQNIPNMEMKELSMGMSNDYEIAIEEGSTMVRIGSSLFGPRRGILK